MKKCLILFLCMTHNFIFAQSVSVEKYFPEDYAKNGSVDYTDYIQRALDENQIVVFPDFPVLINENGLYLRDNQTINFRNNSKLLIKPNSNERYAMLNIINVENITINNPILVGDRYAHLNNKGEWGMGINILSAKNVKITEPYVSSFWGDGIYIGEIDYKERSVYNKTSSFYSENITIQGGVIDNNRRNGISIISVKNLLIENTTIQNTNGTLPMAGIDIEPNNNEQYLENIVLKNIITKNNKEMGIKYVPNNFFGHRLKNVNIKILNCRDIGAKTGLYLGGILHSRRQKLRDIRTFDGEILVEGFISINNVEPIKGGSIQTYNPRTLIRSFRIFDKNYNEISNRYNLRSMLKSSKIQITQ